MLMLLAGFWRTCFPATQEGDEQKAPCEQQLIELREINQYGHITRTYFRSQKEYDRHIALSKKQIICPALPKPDVSGANCRPKQLEAFHTKEYGQLCEVLLLPKPDEVEKTCCKPKQLEAFYTYGQQCGVSPLPKPDEIEKTCCKPNKMAKVQITKHGQCEMTKKLLLEDKDKTKRPAVQYPVLKFTNYTEVLLKQNMVERMVGQIELDKYKHTGVPVTSVSRDAKTNSQLVEVFIRGAKDKFSKISVGDEVELSKPYSAAVAGEILRFKHNSITIEIKEDNRNDVIGERDKLTLEFVQNSYTYDIETDSLHYLNRNNALQFLFPQSVIANVSTVNRPFKFFNTDINSNEKQLQAVRHIVAGTAYPSPYLLFGPPGTGKTKTLVEAISQIFVTDPCSRILVCATSNAAADEITLRLLKNLPNKCPSAHNVYRIYSKSFRPEKPLDNDLRKSSNFDLNFCPDWQHLGKFSIIVATMIVGGGLRYSKSLPLTFTHLFIDECGSATEIATLAPIALCRPDGPKRAHIILSGDPKQLGPVVSQEAKEFGYGISLLERLMDCSVYQKDPCTNRYNPNVITQLVNNYRSHSAIIDPSNRFFYDGALVACGNLNISKTQCFVGWNQLPNPKNPIVFHASTAPSDVDPESKSVYNTHEVNIIVDYVCSVMKESINGQKVKESDIGIISPYKIQCAKIKKALHTLHYSNIMVATVESFQGSEKPIIMISTARSGMNGIGFLADPKRLNVMLTRAQCLMVIVGNPNQLRQNKWWRNLLDEFKRMKVCTGDQFTVHQSGHRRRNK